MMKDTFFEDLDVPLSEDEVLQRSRSLARLLSEKELLKEQKKNSAKSFGDRIKGVEKKEDELARAVRTSKEPRSVECKELFGGEGIVDIVRLDGVEPRVVRSRGMTEGEIRESRQGKLFVLDSSKKKAPAAKDSKDANKLEAAPELAPEQEKGETKLTMTMVEVEKKVEADGSATADEAARSVAGATQTLANETGSPVKVTVMQNGQELVQVKKSPRAEKPKATEKPAAKPKAEKKPRAAKAASAAVAGEAIDEGDGTLV